MLRRTNCCMIFYTSDYKAVKKCFSFFLHSFLNVQGKELPLRYFSHFGSPGFASMLLFICIVAIICLLSSGLFFFSSGDHCVIWLSNLCPNLICLNASCRRRYRPRKSVSGKRSIFGDYGLIVR